MKTRLLAIFVVAVMVGLSACGGGDKPLPPDPPKSSAKEIISFSVSGVAYTVSGNNITFNYPKTAANTWNPAVPSWPVAPTISISDKATISPAASATQNFETAAVTYTVTAEDGTTKTFTVRATKQAEL